MNNMRGLAYLLALGGTLFVSCKNDVKETGKPNILFILSDDHARTAISAYGGINAAIAPTPNIDY